MKMLESYLYHFTDGYGLQEETGIFGDRKTVTLLLSRSEYIKTREPLVTAGNVCRLGFSRQAVRRCNERL